MPLSFSTFFRFAGLRSRKHGDILLATLSNLRFVVDEEWHLYWMTFSLPL
jgi:hypothetical protein